MAIAEANMRRSRRVTYTQPLRSQTQNPTNTKSDLVQDFLYDFNRTISMREDECQAIRNKYPDTVGRFYDELVPMKVSQEEFWQRYFYRCDSNFILKDWFQFDIQKGFDNALSSCQETFNAYSVTADRLVQLVSSDQCLDECINRNKSQTPKTFDLSYQMAQLDKQISIYYQEIKESIEMCVDDITKTILQEKERVQAEELIIQNAAAEASARRSRRNTYTEPLINKMKNYTEEEEKDLSQFIHRFNRRVLSSEACEAVCKDYPWTVARFYNELVPSEVSHEEFWQRYLYRCDPDKIIKLWEFKEKKQRLVEIVKTRQVKHQEEKSNEKIEVGLLELNVSNGVLITTSGSEHEEIILQPEQLSSPLLIEDLAQDLVSDQIFDTENKAQMEEANEDANQIHYSLFLCEQQAEQPPIEVYRFFTKYDFAGTKFPIAPPEVIACIKRKNDIKSRVHVRECKGLLSDISPIFSYFYLFNLKTTYMMNKWRRQLIVSKDHINCENLKGEQDYLSPNSNTGKTCSLSQNTSEEEGKDDKENVQVICSQQVSTSCDVERAKLCFQEKEEETDAFLSSIFEECKKSQQSISEEVDLTKDGQCCESSSSSLSAGKLLKEEMKTKMSQPTTELENFQVICSQKVSTSRDVEEGNFFYQEQEEETDSLLSSIFNECEKSQQSINIEADVTEERQCCQSSPFTAGKLLQEEMKTKMSPFMTEVEIRSKNVSTSSDVEKVTFCCQQKELREQVFSEEKLSQPEHGNVNAENFSFYCQEAKEGKNDDNSQGNSLTKILSYSFSETEKLRQKGKGKDKTYIEAKGTSHGTSVTGDLTGDLSIEMRLSEDCSYLRTGHLIEKEFKLKSKDNYIFKMTDEELQNVPHDIALPSSKGGSGGEIFFLGKQILEWERVKEEFGQEVQASIGEAKNLWESTMHTFQSAKTESSENVLKSSEAKKDTYICKQQTDGELQGDENGIARKQESSRDDSAPALGSKTECSESIIMSSTTKDDNYICKQQTEEEPQRDENESSRNQESIRDNSAPALGVVVDVAQSDFICEDITVSDDDMTVSTSEIETNPNKKNPEEIVLDQNVDDESDSSKKPALYQLRSMAAAVEAQIRRGREVTYTIPLRKDLQHTYDDNEVYLEFLLDFRSTYEEREYEYRKLCMLYPSTVGRFYRKLVPYQLSAEEFWQRYTYRCTSDHIMKDWDRAASKNMKSFGSFW